MMCKDLLFPLLRCASPLTCFIYFSRFLLIKDIQQKINAKRRDNKKLDQKIQEVNLDIAEQGLQRNMDFVEVEHKSSVERFVFFGHFVLTRV